MKTRAAVAFEAKKPLEIVELDLGQKQQFSDAVSPIYAEARSRYSPELMALFGL